jgi:outer membrane beta-barrel protein
MRLFLLLLVLIFASNLYAGVKNFYKFRWLDPDKHIFVLQNKIFNKKGSTFVDLGFGENKATDFQNTTMFNLRGGHYWSEEWGFEVFFSKYSHSDNNAYKEISKYSEAFMRRFTTSYGLYLIYSPFYAKINTFNKIFYFDFNFGAGLASISGENNRRSIALGSTTTTFEKESYTGMALKWQIKFYITKTFNLSLEMSRTWFQAQKALELGDDPNDSTREMKNVVEVIVAGGVTF